MNFASGETILVIGLGRSGLASTEILRARGATVYAVDEKPASELGEAIAAAESLGAHFILPQALDSIAESLDVAVLSPGVPLNGALVRSIQRADVPVFSEIEVAYRLCKAPIVAVTGTKGKSTTTSLIGHLLAAGGNRVRVGGNIGNPLIREVLDASSDEWVVAEVSSFQLESIRSFRPRVSVLLNISEDHLDRYYSMDEYAEAKFRIFANQCESDFFVGNFDDPRVAALDWRAGEPRMFARQLWFTLEPHHEHAAMYVRDGTIVFTPFSGDPRSVEIMRCDRIPLAGRHNVQNVMAALLAALAAGVAPQVLGAAVESFRPMEHRLSPAGDVGGVVFIDDSKATNPGSAIAALRAFDRPCVLIAGGKSKNTDFTELGRAIDERAKGLVVIGEAGDEIARHVARVPVERAASIEDAVQRALGMARPGWIVLLSPACASFDMFASAEDRGRQFVAAVASLREPAPR